MIQFKILIHLMIFLLPGLRLIAAPAEKNPDKASEKQALSPKQQLDKSLLVWNALTKKQGNDYTYTVRNVYMMGNGNITTIRIQKGKVISRQFARWNKPGEPPKEVWNETKKDIGTHDKGAPALTMEQLYELAQKTAAKKLKQGEKLYLKFDKKNLLQHCFVVNTMIADDAPRTGVSISQITWE